MLHLEIYFIYKRNIWKSFVAANYIQIFIFIYGQVYPYTVLVSLPYQV